MDEKKAVTMDQLLESARQSEALTMQVAQAAQAELKDKQGKLTGAAGQVVGFDAEGKAVAQDAPQTGLSQEDADGRYFKKTGGLLTGQVALYKNGADLTLDSRFIVIRSTNEGKKANYTYKDLYFEDNSELCGLELNASKERLDVFSTDDSGNKIPAKLGGLSTPIEDDEATNKKYVDDEISALKARIAALEAKQTDGA